jgi:hypothetical protein
MKESAVRLPCISIAHIFHKAMTKDRHSQTCGREDLFGLGELSPRLGRHPCRKMIVWD